MTKSVQQNVSTLIFKVNAGTPGIKRDSPLDEKLFRNETLFRTLLDSLNNLSDEIMKLDSLFEKKHTEK